MPFKGKQLVSPPAPPLPMGNWLLDKCQMPLPLALRLKKLMHDVGDIEPESLFLSVIHSESLGVWRLGFKQNIMRQGKELQGDIGSARAMGMHVTTPQGI